jgi:hypothetical protein
MTYDLLNIFNCNSTNSKKRVNKKIGLTVKQLMHGIRYSVVFKGKYVLMLFLRNIEQEFLNLSRDIVYLYGIWCVTLELSSVKVMDL